MITSFKLPDLVLGVNIRADVTGARAAARQLRNAVASEFARAGGLGMGGLGGGAAAAAAAAAGGAGGGGFGAALLGAGVGTALIRQPALPQLRGSPAQQRLAELMRSGRILAAAGDRATKKLMKQNLTGTALTRSSEYQKLVMMRVAYENIITDVRGARAQVIKDEIKKATAPIKKTGLLTGLRKALRLWHFLIGGLIIGTVVGGAKRMLGPALQYIRNTGTTTGRYGAFSNAAEATPSALRNVSVQFGLMAIELLNLGEALQDFNRILVQLGSVLGWLGQQKWLMWFIKVNPNLVLTRLANWALGKLPTGKGGVDLGAGGLSSRMAPAALQGSVQAYSILQGNLMNYAAATARNTKQTVDALNKIMERAPQMGVVAG